MSLSYSSVSMATLPQGNPAARQSRCVLDRRGGFRASRAVCFTAIAFIALERIGLDCIFIDFIATGFVDLIGLFIPAV